jgi:hypothetical protein
LVSASSSVNLPFDFSIHPAYTSRFACHSRNTNESVSPYTGCSLIPFSLYLFGHAASQMSNTIPLVYPRMNDPMNEHLLVMNDSCETFFLPLRTSNSPHWNMSVRVFWVTKLSASCHVDTILTTSLRSLLRVYPYALFASSLPKDFLALLPVNSPSFLSALAFSIQGFISVVLHSHISARFTE